MIHSIFEAYDDWDDEMLAVWKPHINRLEAKAQETVHKALVKFFREAKGVVYIEETNLAFVLSCNFYIYAKHL